MIEWAPHAQRLQRAIDRGEDPYWTLPRIKAAIEAREVQIWPGVESTGLTDFIERDGARVVRILLGAGKMGEILDMLDAVEHWAADIGADRIETDGRDGWRRVLTRYGYRVDGETYFKEVQNHGQR